MLTTVACLSLQYFFHIISQTARFSEKKLLDTKCVFWFSLQRLSETFLILWRIRRDIVINVQHSTQVAMWSISHYYRILIKLELFSADFRKILKNKLSRKSVERKPSCFARTYRKTDTTKLTVASRRISYAPNEQAKCSVTVTVYDTSHSPLPLNKLHIFKLTSFPQAVYHSSGDTDSLTRNTTRQRLCIGRYRRTCDVYGPCHIRHCAR